MTDHPNEPTRKRSLGCKVHLHKYHAAATDEGIRYLVCSRCGKESFPEPKDLSHLGGS